MELGVVARDGIEPSTRGFSIQRRARFGASKSKTGNGFPLDRPNRPARPSPYRTARAVARLEFCKCPARSTAYRHRDRTLSEPRTERGPAGSGTPHPRPRSRRRGLIASTTRPAKSASNRRTIRGNTITPQLGDGPAAGSVRAGSNICGAQIEFKFRQPQVRAPPAETDEALLLLRVAARP